MTVLAIIVAIVLALLALRFVVGLMKFGAIAIIAVAVIYFLARSGGIS
jgi:hypothetical protein